MGCGKKYPTVCSYLQKITAFYSIFYFDKVMPYWVRSSSEFLHITWKTQKIVISLQQYDRSPQNLARWRRTRMWSVWLLKISILTFQDGGQPPSWKLTNCNISWWCKIGRSTYRPSTVFSFCVAHFNGRHTWETLCHISWRSVVLLQRCRNFHVFPGKCKNSLDDRA